MTDLKSIQAQLDKLEQSVEILTTLQNAKSYDHSSNDALAMTEQLGFDLADLKRSVNSIKSETTREANARIDSSVRAVKNSIPAQIAEVGSLIADEITADVERGLAKRDHDILVAQNTASKMVASFNLAAEASTALITDFCKKELSK